MPVSSLPSAYGIGTLGAGAYAFVDWLQKANMKIWQVLPLLPTGYGDSPYQSFASDALNYYFIDFALLEKDGLLTKDDYVNAQWGDDARRVDYGLQFAQKTQILRKAFDRFEYSCSCRRTFHRTQRFADLGQSGSGGAQAQRAQGLYGGRV